MNARSFACLLTPSLLAFAVTACGDDGGTGQDTDPGTTGGSTTDDSASSTTDDPTTGVSTSGDPTTDPTDECTPDDPCQTDADCPGGGMCSGCVCIGGDACADGRPDGTYGDCLTDMGSVDITQCGAGPMPGCIVDDPTAPQGGICFFAGCTDTTNACDCPVGPAGFEDAVTCGSLTDAMVNDCYIDCSNGAGCPDGAFCVSNLFCVFGEPTLLPTYGDCFNLPGTCDGDMGACVTDGMTYGVCTDDCMDVMDCPDAPMTGDAPVVCTNVTDGQAGNECALDCSGGQTCPDGMSCLTDAICVWQAPNLGFGDCENYDAANACDPADMEFCTSVTGMVDASVCLSPCMAASDCADAPATGDAPVTCGEVDDTNAGNECYLDCSGGETCPDGMICVGNEQCMFEADATTVFEEDFEGSTNLPMDWVVHDEDGLTPNMQVTFVNDAWVILTVANNNLATSTSYYQPAGQADDWLVTPQISVGANDTLRWLAASVDADFPDGYEVLITTVGNQPADFMDAPVFSVEAEVPGSMASPFTPRFIDLADAGYANMDIYVAFRNTSTDEFLLRVDDVRVTN